MPPIWIAATVIAVMTVVSADQQGVIEALMDESLRSNRVKACDGERITLQCPKNTHIQIETGFYGRVVPISQLCPERDGKPVPTMRPYYDATCDVIHAQSRLSELCDKRRKCTIYVDAATFQEDPCPATSKYLQMSYKCKPVSFDGESFCSGTEMQLDCREGRRLAVYSATYGRTARGQPAHCAMPPKSLFSTDCTRDVLGHVLTRCHAQTGCSLSISDRSLGRPCPRDIPPYLNIIFMCVNEEVFSEDAIRGELKNQRLLSELEANREKFSEGSGAETDHEWAMEEQKGYHHDEASSSSHGTRSAHSDLSMTSQQNQPRIHAPDTPTMPAFHNDASFVAEELHPMTRPTESEPDLAVAGASAVGIAHDIALIWTFLQQNKEKVLLCTVLSLSIALILLVLACILQQFCPQKRRQKDTRVRYSIERSNLINRSQLVDCPGGMGAGGHSSFVEMGDLGDEPFMRYSFHTPTRSLHYDFT